MAENETRIARIDTDAAGPPEGTPQTPDRIMVTDVGQLLALTTATFQVEFYLDGRAVSVMCRRLTPREDANLAAIEREIQPKLLKGAKPDDDRYDYMSPEFTAKRERQNRIVRAMALYMACSIIAAGKPGLIDREAILDYVEGLFTEAILQILYLSIKAGGLEVAERVNFTLPPALARN